MTFKPDPAMDAAAGEVLRRIEASERHVQKICTACHDISSMPQNRWECPVCARAPMQVLHHLLERTSFIVFAIVMEETIEERYFSFIPGVMPEPRINDEVRVPLPEDDPLRKSSEWQESGGNVYVSNRQVDFTNGSVWLECHFLVPGLERAFS